MEFVSHVVGYGHMQVVMFALSRIPASTWVVGLLPPHFAPQSLAHRVCLLSRLVCCLLFNLVCIAPCVY
jgi:hypothetical protein